MGVAEPEGVKLPRQDDFATDSASEDDMTVVTHSPPPSPVTVKHQVSVPGMAKTKKDPPSINGTCDSARDSTKDTNQERLKKQNECVSEKTPSAPSSPVPSGKNAVPSSPVSTGKNVVPSSPGGGSEQTKQWAQSELGIDSKRELPKGWTPGPNSVICGRGKECFER